MLAGTSRHRRFRQALPARGLTLVETLVTFTILGFLTTLILQAVGFFGARYDSVQRVHRVAALESLQQNWFATSVQGFVPYGVRAHRFEGHPTYFEGVTLEPLNAQAGTPVTVRWFIEKDAVGYFETLAPTVPGIQWTIRASDTSVRDRAPLQTDTREFGRTTDIATRSRFQPDTGDSSRTTDIEMRSQPPTPPRPEAPPGDLAFHYADVFANWYDHWPPRPDAKPLAEPGRAAAASEPQSVDDVVAALALDALANAAAPASDDPLADPAMDWTPRLIRLVSAEAGTVWLARVEPSHRPLVTDTDYQ